MSWCPDCSPDELMPLQLAANARGAIVGLLTLSFVLVLAVVVAGACLRYTRRLLLAGATLLGVGMGTVFTGIALQRLLPWVGLTPTEGGALTQRLHWLWRGEFHLYAVAAVFLGLVVVFTESRNVVAVTRNRLIPGGVIAGWGLLNIAVGVWLQRLGVTLPSDTTSALQPWWIGFGVSGVALVILGGVSLVSVLRHPRAHKLRVLSPLRKHSKRHAH